jgi:hypothetical protein
MVSSQSVTREQIPEYELHRGAKKGCKEYNGSLITTTILPLGRPSSFFVWFRCRAEFAYVE